MTLRLALAGGFALAGLIVTAPAIKGVCLGLAVLSFVVVPVLGDRLLTPIEAEVAAANRAEAPKLLKELEARWAVRWFAPSAWLAVQQARLQLSSGDPRAAAMSYFEARRASALGASRPELTSAEADAHLHADDRKQALKLLRELEEKKSLAPLDHVNFGVALLSESGHNEAAREHFEKAYKALRQEPRVVAGLALARQRCGDLDGARELLDGDLDLDHSEDRTARDLAKRARKGLKGKGGGSRPEKKTKKKDKKGNKRSEPETELAKQDGATSEASPSEAKPAKSKAKQDKKEKPKGKKARRAARREARKKKEADERAAKAVEREKAEREALEKQQAERDRAAAKAKRASQVKTIPAEKPLTAPISPKPEPVVPKAPSTASGTIGAPKPATPIGTPKAGASIGAPKAGASIGAPKPAAPAAPPKADSLFGSMFAPPKLGTPASAPKAPAPVVPPPVAVKTPAVPKVAAPSLDDLFAPPTSGSAPVLPAAPTIGAPPVVPPPPISAPKVAAPPKLDDWGSDLGLPAAPLLPPPVAKPKSDDK